MVGECAWADARGESGRARRLQGGKVIPVYKESSDIVLHIEYNCP